MFNIPLKMLRFSCLLEGRCHNLLTLFCYLIFNPVLRFRCQGIWTLGILLTLLQTVLKIVVVYIMKYILKWLRNFMIYIFGGYFTSGNSSLWAECWKWVEKKNMCSIKLFYADFYVTSNFITLDILLWILMKK